MKKIYLFGLVIGVAALLNSATAQEVEFPWPDLGEAMVIEPGPPGTINNVINGDTTATGERLHSHYVLKRGQTYLYTARIQNSGYPLMVTAEEGDGDLPIIKALGPAPGEDEAERAFHAEGDLYLKDIAISGWDQGGNFTDNATVRLAADSITVVIKSVVFDFNRQNNFRINAKDCKIYIEDCIVANQGYGGRFNQGFFFNTRGNYFPIAHLRNNTIYNMQNSVIEHQGNSPRTYQKLIFEYNTIMNTGASGLRFGRPDSLIFKNNLIVNMGILGDAVYGDRDNFVEPYYFADIDSVFTDTTNTELAMPYVDWRNNYFYFDPEVAALLPDSANPSHETMFHPYLADLIGESQIHLMDEKFEFQNFPATLSEYQQHIDDFYNRAEVRSDLPQFNTPWYELDFSYPESSAAYSFATDGGPIGDRNWFPDYVSTSAKRIVKEGLMVYPNPASGELFVKLNNNFDVKRIVLYNMLGQMQKSLYLTGEKDVRLNIGDLNEGLHLIRFFDEQKVIAVKKIIIKR